METNVAQGQVFQSDENGQWYWRAVAGNNEIVCTSESYTRKESAVRAFGDTFPGVPSYMSEPRDVTVDEEGAPAEAE